MGYLRVSFVSGTCTTTPISVDACGARTVRTSIVSPVLRSLFRKKQRVKWRHYGVLELLSLLAAGGTTVLDAACALLAGTLAPVVYS
jgi:hypothetical protein